MRESHLATLERGGAVWRGRSGREIGAGFPRSSQHQESLVLERPLDQGKHGVFLVVEVDATGVQDGAKPRAGLGEVLDLLHVPQESIEFLMVVVETVELVALLQDVIQSDVSQVGFCGAVVVEKRFQEATEQADLVHGVYGRQYAFNLIEQAQKDTMLGDQAIDDRHRQTVVQAMGKSNDAGGGLRNFRGGTWCADASLAV